MYDALDTVEMNIPLLIRLLEWAREEAPDDVAIHIAAENANRLSDPLRNLTMEDYEEIVGE
jgi:hypothetical protein